MALVTGTRLGRYEITAPLGAGGMGEVYRARDAALSRDVAIKVLPALVATDPDRLARFEREARVLASLDHPNIATVHGFEDADGVKLLVMELVQGPTLADRIASGPIPVDEALPIAKQIAEALEAAHERGIIHRDLKPSNIKLRADGSVKVLDFGLAKALEPPGTAGADPAVSPTITSPALTQLGVILGTAAYMSPEQAKGGTVDKRSDVWAFGCVLYEMVTGRRAFEGEDMSETLAAVIRAEPDWTRVPIEVPLGIRTVLRRCLEKHRTRRVPDISVARFAIEDALTGLSDPPTGTQTAPARVRIALVGLAVMLTALVTALSMWWVRPHAAIELVRLEIEPVAGGAIGTELLDPDIAVSPDGRRVVYASGTPPTLYVRELDQLEPKPLLSTTGGTARSPFFSPDGAWVGFVEGVQSLRKVALAGGAPVTICETDPGGPRGASWGANDTIVFATGAQGTGLYRVSAAGGKPVAVTTPDRVKGEQDHVFPAVLPGGAAVLFTIQTGGPEQVENNQIAILDLRTGSYKVLVRGGTSPRYARSGHIIYNVGATLHAVAFDLARGELGGDPVPVVEQVVLKSQSGATNVALADNGTLVYQRGEPVEGLLRTVVWVSRKGDEEPLEVAPRSYVYPRVSPDGKRVALQVLSRGQFDIWVWERQTGTATLLTVDPEDQTYPLWRDDQTLIFSSGRPPNLFSQRADGSAPAERLTESVAEQNAQSVSPDGQALLFRQGGGVVNGWDLHLLSLAAERHGRPLLVTGQNEFNGEISPNGAWIAFQSRATDDAGYEVYVRPFPDVERARWQVSVNGGTRPAWSRDGKGLYYVAADGRLMSVPVDIGGGVFQVRGGPVSVLDPQIWLGTPGRSYDIAPDGRILIVKELSGEGSGKASAPLVVVLNWLEELTQRVPAR